jgi:misacylated tRNA(Ala) deacylase
VTVRLDLGDPYVREFDAEVVACADGWCALSRTAFHPGGGGQPPDRGDLVAHGAADGRGGAAGGETVGVLDIREDAAGRVWHRVDRWLAAGTIVRGVLDWPYRYALMRHHGLMHVVNTVARDAYGGVITGVQLGPERSRIDLRLTGFAREQLADFEARVNGVIARGLAVTASVIDEAEFHARPELVRTLNVRPPVVDGRVRVVAIAGFDAQACGGTHVHATGEIGRATIARFDNKGRDNKRFYWDLAAADDR